jgi:uncharacterized YigZ family protein
MIERFKTIKKPAEIEFIEKGSRFIGYAFVVESEAAALSQIADLRRAHVKAAHNCYAYSIGLKSEIVRQNDDGEPSGTAGLPILDVIAKQDLKNVLVVVTRYFGGVLLGAGGLVRAYSRAAAEAINSAGIITQVLHQKFRITAAYNLGGKLEHEIRSRGYVLNDIIYTENIEFIVSTAVNNSNNLIKNITDITAGAADIVMAERIYLAS